MKLTPNFRLSEFLSEGDDVYPTNRIIQNLIALANRLQVLRDILGRPITITSGYRSVEYNATIPNSAKNSYHTRGMAADIQVKGMSPQSVQQYLQEWSGGLGSYSSFTHIDIRSGAKARW